MRSSCLATWTASANGTACPQNSQAVSFKSCSFDESPRTHYFLSTLLLASVVTDNHLVEPDDIKPEAYWWRNQLDLFCLSLERQYKLGTKLVFHV